MKKKIEEKFSLLLLCSYDIYSSMGMENGHAVWVCSMGMQQGTAA
jgi:hypothetical protein